MLPQPTSVRPLDGSFTLAEETALGGDVRFTSAMRWLRGVLQASTGFEFAAPDAGSTPTGTAPAGIDFAFEDGLDAEEYRIRVDASGVHITASEPAGAFCAAVTVTQLLPAAVNRRGRIGVQDWRIEGVSIEDAPRFGWRGVMLDVARHFMPKSDVMRFIDLAARHKLNVLHFHLTDDQGWRIEIKRYPRLTEVGGWRTESQDGAAREVGGDGRPHGGFYTQDDLREIVAYAADRFVTVVPEIDIPGHARAIVTAYPELAVSDVEDEEHAVWTRWGINETVLNIEESTVQFFRNVFDEVMDVFPAAYIGVGGDEAKKVQWEQSASTAARMTELGLANADEVQSWFIHQLDDHLTAAGRRLFGWDEILEGGLAPGATIASWRGLRGAVAAAKSGHDVVACPDDKVYLDYRESEHPGEPTPVGPVLTVEDVYAFEPVPESLTPEEALHVIGGQANIWTEHMDTARVVDYHAFPRLCALAEVVWHRGERDFTAFSERLEAHLPVLEALGVEYRRADGPRPWQERPDAPGRPTTLEARLALVAAMTKNIAVE